MTAPDTIVLVRGFWVTPRSWEEWQARFEQRGFRVLVPAYPGFEVEVEALSEDMTPIADLTVPAVVEKLAAALRCPHEFRTFTTAEGAGDHCEAGARTLFHARAFDWLDGVLGR